MAFQSIVDLSGTAGQSNFTFAFPYISRDHIHVYLDGVETTLFTFNSDFVIHLTTPLVIAQTVRVRRITPSDLPLVDFVNGATLGEIDLDTTTLQMLYVVQEAQDLQAIDIGSSLRVPEEIPLMAAASARANNFLYFDANGDPTVQPMVGTTLAFTPLVQLFSGDGAQTAFTLSSPPGAAAALIVALSGVVQKPNTDFTLAGSTLTFTTAPAVGTNNIAVQNFGVAREVSTVPSSGIVGQIPSTQVDYLPTMTGGILRTQASTNGDRWSVKDFQCVGDGVTSDQTRLAAAVSAAFATSQELYWPKGTYVSTATIPNFHDVEHRGPGIVKRGSTLFYVDPSLNPGVTNNLYVSTTGVDTYDGLSAAEPRQTPQATGNLIYKYPYGDITWKISCAAGTYSVDNCTFSRPFPSPNRVQLLGPTVSIGIQPTAIFQATLFNTGGVNGIYITAVKLQISHINFKKYRAGAAVSNLTLSSGVTCDAGSDLYTYNVWTDECDLGIFGQNGSILRIQGGRHGFNAINGAGVQIGRFCTGTVGYGGSAFDVTGATGTAFIGGAAGVVGQEFAMFHADYCYFSAQTQAGLFLTNATRCHAVSSKFDTCVVGIDARGESLAGETSCTYTSCTNDRYVRGNSIRVGVGTFPVDDSTYWSAPLRDSLSMMVTNSTQSTSLVTAYTYAFEAKESQNRGSGFDLNLQHYVTGVVGTKTVEVSLGGVVLLTATIGAAVASTRIQVSMRTVTATNSLHVSSIISQDGIAPVVAYTNVTTVDMTAAQSLVVKHKVTNAADTSRVAYAETHLYR